ncbi:MAG: hypothetical protein Q4G52_08150 [Clostridia bacterium]|nr:hypothetical protein [Clostridia bacterium]
MKNILPKSILLQLYHQRPPEDKLFALTSFSFFFFLFLFRPFPAVCALQGGGPGHDGDKKEGLPAL